MVRYFGPDNGSAYVDLPNGRPAVGRVASVYADEDATVLADILSGTRDEMGEPVTNVLVDSTGRLNFWFPDDQPVVWVRVNDGPLVRVTADLQDQLDDAIIDGGGGGGVTIGQVNAAIATHNADSTGVHGITDTSALETTAGAQSKADVAQGTAISTAAADATSKAATAQSNAISTASAAADGKIAAHAIATDPHGDRAYADGQLADKADLVGGVIPSSQIPAIAITDFLGTVANQTAMLALIGQRGDWAIRSDTGTTWVITGNTPSNLSSWTQMPSAGAPVVSVNGFTGAVTLAKADIGLGSVDNTADPDKPVSTAAAAALAGKQDVDADLTAIGGLAPANNDLIQRKSGVWTNRTPAQVKTDMALVKADVGLSNVDNTADSSKTFTEAQVTGLTTDLAAKQPLDADLTTIAGLTATTDNMIQSVASAWASRTPAQVKAALAIAQSDVSGLTAALAAKEPTITAGTTAQYWRGDKSWQTLDKTAVGLANVDNTSDAAKPLSSAATTALAAKADLVGGLVPTSQMPPLVITEVFTAISQAAMLALTAQRGDVAVRTDAGKTFILSTDSPGTLADWKEVSAIGAVTSVSGQQGIVVLAKGDVGLGNVSNALQLIAANNLSDLTNAGTARTNLGVPPSTRAVTAGTGLTGGGDLSVDRAFAVAYGAASGTAAQGNDNRITGAIQASTGTTKGDLLAFTASGTVARVAVGSNGDVLTADSAQTPGLKWQNNRQTQTWAFTGTAAITTGKARWYNRTGRTLTVVGCWAAANTVPTGAAIVVDVNKNGTSFYGTATKPQVAISSNGGGLAAPDTGTTVADGDYITVDVDSVGSTIAGADVTVGLVYA